MTNFTIDPSTDKIEVSGSKRDQAIVFSVGNKTGVDRRIRGLFDATPAEAVSWFTVREPDTVPLRINETAQLTVDVEVPTDAIGEATLQLRVVATDDPDDTYGISQKIPVQVAAAKEQKRFPWWIIVAIVAVLAVIGVVVVLLMSREDDPEPLSITSITTNPVSPINATIPNDATQSAMVTFSVETNYTGSPNDLIVVWRRGKVVLGTGVSSTIKLSAGCPSVGLDHTIGVAVLFPEDEVVHGVTTVTVNRTNKTKIPVNQCFDIKKFNIGDILVRTDIIEGLVGSN
jgi:hypothetical protein